MRLLKLFFQQCMQKHRVQILRDCGMIALRNRHNLRYGHDAVDNVQRIEGLCRSSDTVRLLLQSRRAYLGVGISHVSVFQLTRIRHGVDVKDKAFIFNVRMSEQPQVGCRQRLQHAHPAGSVTQAVMRLQCNAIAEIIDSDKVSVVPLKIHRLAWILDIRLHKRSRTVVRLKVSPEQSFADRCLVCRKSRQCHVKSLLKHFRLNFLLQYHRQPVHGRKVPSL